MQASFLIKSEDTFAAGLDVRLKLLLCFAGSVLSIVLSSPAGLGLLAGAGTLLALGAARPATILKVYVLTTAMLLMALGFSALIGLAVPGMVRWDAFSLSVPFLRMLVSVNLLLVLALSTPVRELFTRLQSLRLPAWLYVPLSVAVRFIPSFLGDCAQIRDAARLRPGRGIAGLWRGLVVPLIFRILYSADDLAMAAELKGIGLARRTVNASPPGFGRRDRLVLLLAAATAGAAVALQAYGPQLQPLPM